VDNNREMIYQRHAEYYAQHKEEERKHRKEYRRQNAAQISANKKEYSERNKERVKRSRQEYYSKNKQRLNAYRAEYHRQHRDEKREYDRVYRSNNLDRGRKYSIDRRARVRNAPGTYAPEDIQIIHKQQKGRCWWCGCKLGDDYHIDHRIALNDGGSNYPENLCLSCPPCNLSKKDRKPWEFCGRLL
jgi:hypothetical protein